ncbi:MAG: hypothetical protein KIT10_03110 [Flavobacteriales bacterium]|nr:hypothetical protein [Flavobacteriales bacterium]
MKQRLVATSLLTALAFTAGAQRFFFENISVAQGLSAKVYAAVQDRHGLVWLGTETGLASYDGIEVVNHGTDKGAASNGARTILIDRDGMLWAGHLDGGITRYNDRSFKAFDLAPGMNSAVTGLAQDAEGHIWAATVGHGLWRFDPTDAEDDLKAERMGQAEGLRDKLLGVITSHDGRLLLVEDGGQVRAWRDGKLTTLDLPGVHGIFQPTAIHEDSRHDLWVGTQGGGAFRFSAAGGAPSRHDISNGLRSSTVICFGEDAEGRVWVGTIDGGAAVIGPEGTRTFHTGNGLHSLFVRCITRDREGNLLIGTQDNGLDIFKGEYFVGFGEPDGLTDPQVFALLEDRQGRTWIGTNGGLVILGPSGKLESTITVQQGRGLPSNFIRCLVEDDKGWIWIGTENAGVSRFDPRTGRIQNEVEISAGLGFGTATALEAGQSGEIWVGGFNGVRRHIPSSGTVPMVYTEAEGLANNHVKALYRDSKGTIWVGSTVKGVSRIDNGIVRTVDLGRGFTATAFVEDPDGRLWVGTEGQGIIVLEKDREVNRFSLAEGLLSNTIRALGVDTRGNVWIGTNKGLNMWRHKQDGFIAFTERAGFTGIEVKPGAVCVTRAGDIWFGTVNGATRVHGERVRTQVAPPLVALRGWRVNMEDRGLEAGASLDHTERNLRLLYGCVALSDPAAVRYMHKLVGLDNDWQPLSTSTEAYYPALPPGSYEFQVKAMDRTGQWSETASFAFAILPPWYRSWWFYSALVLFIAITLFSYIKVRERQLRLRNMALERKVQERTAEVVAQSREIEGQKERIEDLLLNILPKRVSDELKDKGRATARLHDEVTVLFTDFKGFTMTAERMTPEELVDELDSCFILFDDVVGRYGVEKIKTIGDSYMCAAGVPIPDAFHAHKCVLAALEIRDLIAEHGRERALIGKAAWSIRIGLHSGAVVAGVVGKRKFAYDIWGDTVNTASRMESSGAEGEVNISGTTERLVRDRFVLEHRGRVEAKNKAATDMYFVRGIKPEYSADGAGRRPNKAFLRELGLQVRAEQHA